MGNGKELTGMRFERLVVIARDLNYPSTHERYWICKCDCGNEKTVSTSHLVSGTVKSCGCMRKEKSIERFRKASQDNVTHGESRTALYSVWHLMKERCENPNLNAYRYYGAKGIKVCDEWQKYEGFAEWAHSHGYKYMPNASRKDRMSIDRIDSDGDYCPENCRWITVSENTRRGALRRWENAKRAE